MFKRTFPEKGSPPPFHYSNVHLLQIHKSRLPMISVYVEWGFYQENSHVVPQIGMVNIPSRQTQISRGFPGILAGILSHS